MAANVLDHYTVSTSAAMVLTVSSIRKDYNNLCSLSIKISQKMQIDGLEKIAVTPVH